MKSRQATRKNKTHIAVSNPPSAGTDIKQVAPEAKDGSVLAWTPEMLSPFELRPAKRNARTHPKKQIEGLAGSIRDFGFNSPIVVDDRNRIVCGHARAEAAKLVGLTRIPAVRASHLSESQLRAYALADNKLAEKAGWDREALIAEL